MLSPVALGSGGGANGFILYPSGFIGGNDVRFAYGARPAISLTSEITAVSGTGVATDPWIVNPPAP